MRVSRVYVALFAFLVILVAFERPGDRSFLAGFLVVYGAVAVGLLGSVWFPARRLWNRYPDLRGPTHQEFSEQRAPFQPFSVSTAMTWAAVGEVRDFYFLRQLLPSNPRLVARRGLASADDEMCCRSLATRSAKRALRPAAPA
ncbi:MAG: hypothetical protein ACLQCU_05990 [Acidimicrobiales bacterium]